MKITITIKRPSSKLKRSTGTVGWFNPKLGYGFIDKDDGSQIFVHYNEIKMDGYKKLTTGQIVSFGIKPNGKYSQATEVKLEQNSKQ